MNADNPGPPDPAEHAAGKGKRPRIGIGRHLRAYFLAGVLVTAPIGITLYLTWVFVHWVDSQVTPLIPAAYNPETYLRFSVPGLGLLVAVVVLTVIGATTAGLLGRFVVGMGENMVARMPIIRSIYGATKQIFETVLAKQSTAFREVVLIEYPRRDCWVIGFITGRTVGEVQTLTDEEVVNVFVPTTPNPTSGFLLFVPRKDVVTLSMTVEEGIKMVVSGGIVVPPEPGAAANGALAARAAASGLAKSA